MPTAAQSTERYLCPDCLEPVRLDQKGGEAHFVHDQPEECRLEGPGWMRHSGTLAAYVQVRMAIEGSAQMPRLSRTCGQCGSTGWQGLPADLTNVDVTCHDQRGHVEDILLFRGPQAACSVVLVEHVPSDLDDLASRARSKALLVLRADEVLLDPASWRPAWEAGLRDWRCEGCR